MNKIILSLAISLCGLAAFAVPSSTDAIYQLPDATGTNMVFQVLKDGTVKADGIVSSAGIAALLANSASYTNVIKSGDNKTNTIIVINGQVTSWVVTQ